MANAAPHTAIILMGVSGCGKTTVAKLLADRLGWTLLEGDDFHPKRNVEKMSHGMPLNDDDREPWLRAIAAAIDEARRGGRQVIVTCSALKRAYRDLLVDDHPDVIFVYLKGSKALIADRLKHRAGHFMPAGLLDSQFAALEEPGAGEPAIAVPIDRTPEAIADDVLKTLGVDARR
jgi:carbohydrate kinase (thermoresistant glucokinase family)